METQTHRWLDYLDHLWPYISGVFITLLAVIRLWWYDRHQTRKRIGNLEVLAEHMVTTADLQACRDNVRDDDEKNMEKVFAEIKELTKENAAQHQDIMKQILRLHAGE